VRDKIAELYTLPLIMLSTSILCLALSDVVLLPFIFLLFITYYRFKPIRVVLSIDKKGFRELNTIMGQTLLLMMDICIIWPFTILIFLSQVRWIPVYEIFSKEVDLFDDFKKSMRLYKCIFRQVYTTKSFRSYISYKFIFLFFLFSTVCPAAG
jgi:hypothetical protein